MKTKLLLPKEYKTFRGMTTKEEVFKWLANVEAEAMSESKQPQIPKYTKTIIPFTTASAYAFGRNIIKAIMP